MIKIKLIRLGVRGKPFYRIVAMNSRSKLSSTPHQTLGFWHPKTGNKKIDKEALKKWIGEGAKLTKKVSEIIG